MIRASVSNPATLPRRAARLTRLVVGTATLVLSLTLAALPIRGNPGLDASVTCARRPVALARLDDRLLVANARSGTISLVDRQRAVVLSETGVGSSLSDLVVSSRGLVFALDEARGELVTLTLASGDRLVVQDRCEVARAPVCVRERRSDGVLAVSSLWARVVTLFARDPESGTSVERARVPVSFAPRLLAWLPGGELVVADSHGGQLAVLEVAEDAGTANILARRVIDGHNIRGLSVSSDGRSLLVAHLQLDPDLPTARPRVFWGGVLGGFLRTLSIAELTRRGVGGESPVPLARWTLEPLGEPGRGAGDPGAIGVLERMRIVALSGVDEISFDRRGDPAATRVAVPDRPTALLVDPEARTLWIACTGDDVVVRCDLETFDVTASIALSPARDPDLVERGEGLFFDARLSLDGWYSCHSCHTDGHTNGLLNDNYGDETEGTPKLIPSLLGVRNSAPWAWSGTRARLADQIRSSIATTMRLDVEPPPSTIDALVAYLESLEPPPPRVGRVAPSHETGVSRGEAVFKRARCASCHMPPFYTSSPTREVGLADEAGRTEWSPPSLLGVGQRERFLHDGRASSLGQVLDGHPPDARLDRAELLDLVEFLESL